MPSLRSLFQTGLAATCVSLIAIGLFMSSAPVGEGVVLDRPGSAGRLVSGGVTATAFFEMVGDELELTMLFAERDEKQGVMRSSVRLLDGQRHTIVLREDGDGRASRFVFRRLGYKVEMRLDPASTLSATLDFNS